MDNNAIMERLFQSTPSKRKETSASHAVSTVVRSFNPLLPSGRRHSLSCASTGQNSFQSTPSKRKETIRELVHRCNIHRFNPLLPSGRRPTPFPLISFVPVVSIHSFQAEGDCIEYPAMRITSVSIHSFQAEGAYIRRKRSCKVYCFNPLLPSGRRPV